jgi:hypothetical protein
MLTFIIGYICGLAIASFFSYRAFVKGRLR